MPVHSRSESGPTGRYVDRAGQGWLDTALEATGDAVVGVTLGGLVTSWGEDAERLFGCPAQEMLGTPFGVLLPPEAVADLQVLLGHVGRGERVVDCSTRCHSRDGGPLVVSLSLLPKTGPDDQLVGALLVCGDLSLQPGAAQDGFRLESAYRRAFDSCPTVMWMADAATGQALLVNDAAVALYGYTRTDFDSLTATDIQPAGDLTTCRHDPSGHGSGCRAVHRRQDGTVVDVCVSTYPIVLDSGAAHLVEVEELAGSGSAGVPWQRSRPTAGDVTRAHVAGVEALANLLACRDPFTAVHLRRVSVLAAAIAVQLGLDDEQVECVRLGGLVHDIGKVALPTEILVSRDPLSTAAYEMVKGHPQAGHDVLAGTAYPWPLAGIVLMHHERLDGSGYPQGLRGDQIPIAARIVAVADVAEAMTTDRSYQRPVGTEAALAVLNRGRGTLFDSSVVDALVEVLAAGTVALGDRR